MKKLIASVIFWSVTCSLIASEQANDSLEKRFAFGNISASIKKNDFQHKNLPQSFYEQPFDNTEYDAFYNEHRKWMQQSSSSKLSTSFAITDRLKQRDYFLGLNIASMSYNNYNFIKTDENQNVGTNIDYEQHEVITYFEAELGTRIYNKNDCSSRMKVYIEPAVIIPYLLSYSTSISKNTYVREVVTTAEGELQSTTGASGELHSNTQSKFSSYYAELAFNFGGQYRLTKEGQKWKSWIFLQADNTIMYSYNTQYLDLKFFNLNGGIRIGI